MAALLVKIQCFMRDESSSAFNKAAIYLIDTYGQAVLDYARGGMGIVAAKLIMSNIEDNYMDGMEMFTIFAQSDQVKMVDLLLEDKEIRQTGVWERFTKSNFLVRNRSEQVRKFYHMTLNFLLSAGHNEHIKKICGWYRNGMQEDVLDMLRDEIDFNAKEHTIL